MNSKVLPSFWRAYESLDAEIRQRARKSYAIWRINPFHPSLYFKCVNKPKNLWSVRISHSYRALGIVQEDTIFWIWIGSHDDYDHKI